MKNEKTRKRNCTLIAIVLAMVLSLSACGSSSSTSASVADAPAQEAESTPASVAETPSEEKDAYTLGPVVAVDEASPSGVTVTFTFDASTQEKEVESVKVNGMFQYVDPTIDDGVEGNHYSPYDYRPGMYPCVTVTEGENVYTGGEFDMARIEGTDLYTVSFPITSGGYLYWYKVTYTDGTTEDIDDPANPSGYRQNPKTQLYSTVYGLYNEKQGVTPNMDYVRPRTDGKTGTVSYLKYTGSMNDSQDMGVYLPYGYDENRAEPYKVIYMSHGGGGTEMDWLEAAHVGNIIDNLELDYVVITMDNAIYEWDQKAIQDNIMNYLIPYVEENFNVSTEPADRAFTGLSMGGITTMNMWAAYPTEFAYFGAYAGADTDCIDVTKEGLDQPIFYINYGTRDIPWTNERLDAFLAFYEENPMDNVIYGGQICGSHDWFEWSQSIKTFMTDIAWNVPSGITK